MLEGEGRRLHLVVQVVRIEVVADYLLEAETF